MIQSRRPREAKPEAAGYRFGILLSDYHPAVAEALLGGARRCLSAHGARSQDQRVIRVPGAFEIPQAASRLAAEGRRRFDALICLGVLIRGETSHFDLLAQEVCRGLGEVSRREGVPIAFGVLAVDNERQARDRAGRGTSNKGWEAARAAIRMAILYAELDRAADVRVRRRG